ncbi:MAG: hypothetical protein ACRENQ_02520, partial [Gemmatimonadaceae bacterium]
MIQINLLPGATKKAKRGGTARFDFAALLSGASERVKDRWLATAVSVAVVAIGAIAVMFVMQAHRTSTLTATEQQGLADSTRYASVLKDRVHVEAKRDTLLRQL